MADARQEALLRKSVEQWNHWRKCNLAIVPNLERANFTKADLSDANLSGTNLERAFLAQANLQGANLKGTILKGTNLSRTDLSGVDLSGYDLSKTAFCGTDLSEADLSGAILEGANLSDAKLQKANLQGAIFKGANLSGTDLSGADLSGAILEGANLSDAKLQKANLQGAILKGANLSRTDLSRVDLSGYDLSKTAFCGTDLGGANFSGAILEGANLSDAKLQKANLQGAILKGTTFKNVDLSGFDLRDFDLSRVSFGGSNLTKVDFTGANLTDVDFCYTNLADAIIPKTIFGSVNLTGANLTGFDLRHLILTNAKLEKSTLIEVDLSDSILTGANLHESNLTNANLSRTNLEKANLSGAKLSGVELSGANLKAVNLSNTNLSSFDLSGFDLSRANLSNTNLCRTSFAETNLEEANLTDASVFEVNFEKAKLKSAIFVRVNLAKVNFSKFDLSSVRFQGANLTDANFSGSNLHEVDFSIDSSEPNVVKKPPSRRVIRQAILENSTILIRANFSEANLEGANLEGANLEAANFHQACLRNAEISGASLEGANLEGANLEGACFTKDIIEAFKNKLFRIESNEVGMAFGCNHVGSVIEGLTYEKDYKIKELTRYPYLDCPVKTITNQPFSLYVQLLLESPELGITSIQIEDASTSELPKVEIVVRCRGFNIEGSNTQIIEIDRSEDSEVRFVLTPHQIGQQEIRVDYYQYGRRIGTTRRNILVAEQFTTANTALPEPSVAIELKVNQIIPPPDLELCVELDRHDGRTLYYELHSVKPELDYHHTRFGQVTLQASPLEKMQAVYRELSKQAALNLDTQSSSDEQRTLVPLSSTSQMNPERAERRLTTVGNQLWDELISDALKQQYWQFKGHVKSLLITSDEPWVPWEMIKPYRHVNGKEEQDPFWCQQFAISRWLSGPGTADDLSAKVVLPVAPSQSNLSSVQKELTFLSQLTNLRSSLSPVTAFNSGLDLQDYIRENEFSILHFACHGMFDDTSPNDSAIVLADGPLRPSDLRLYFDQKQLRPLIFINACHGGRVGFSFTGLGGWAERLVKARVGAFVGAMWEVNDALALQFARTFYKALLQDDQTIAEAFRQSREVIRQMAPYNSTWLAYCLYADPEARIQEETEVIKESASDFRGTRFDNIF